MVDDPVEAAWKLRLEWVATRRRLVDRGESIKNAQEEIEAIDRAILDEIELAKRERADLANTADA